jgi:hypothetical protein
MPLFDVSVRNSDSRKGIFMDARSNLSCNSLATPDQVCQFCCMIEDEFWPEWQALSEQRREALTEEIGAVILAEERKG